MEEKAQEKNIDALNASKAKSAEEANGPTNSERCSAAWTAFWGKLDHVGTRCKEVTEGLADEIERHPLLGGAAAFGLGFVVAKLLFKRRKKDSRK